MAAGSTQQALVLDEDEDTRHHHKRTVLACLGCEQGAAVKVAMTTGKRKSDASERHQESVKKSLKFTQPSTATHQGQQDSDAWIRGSWVLNVIARSSRAAELDYKELILTDEWLTQVQVDAILQDLGLSISGLYRVVLKRYQRLDAATRSR